MSNAWLRAGIITSLVLSEVAAMINGGLWPIVLPIFGIPAFLLSAYITRFFQIKKPVSRVFLTVIGIFSIFLSAYLTLSILYSAPNGKLGGTLRASPYAQILCMIAFIIFCLSLIGLFIKYYKNKSTN